VAAPLKIKNWLSVDELANRFRQCANAVEKTHWQMIWLKASGRSTKDVSAVCGCNKDWVRRIVRRYNQDGPESLGDGRRRNGNKPILTAEQVLELRDALARRNSHGELWNSRKVALWISERVGRKVWPQTGWTYLQAMEMSLQVPRPEHPENTQEMAEEFKKNFTKRCNS